MQKGKSLVDGVALYAGKFGLSNSMFKNYISEIRWKVKTSLVEQYHVFCMFFKMLKNL